MITITFSSHGKTTVRHTTTLEQNIRSAHHQQIDVKRTERRTEDKTKYEPKFYDHFTWEM